MSITPPNESGATTCTVCWQVETPHGTVSTHNKEALEFLVNAHNEAAENARLLGLGAEREARLMAQVDEELRRNHELQKDADRYRWLKEHAPSWSWQPSKYNSEITSGFAANSTGYLGYGFEEALNMAMKETK